MSDINIGIAETTPINISVTEWGGGGWTVVIDNDKYQGLWIPDSNTWIDPDGVSVPNPAIVSWTWDSWQYRIVNADATSDPWIDNIASDVAKGDTVFYDGTGRESKPNTVQPHQHQANEIEVTPTGNLESTNAQLSLEELQWDIDALFARLDPRDLSFTRDVQNRLTQIIDNINSITINIDRTSFNEDTPLLYIQEAGDSKKFTISYTWDLPSGVSYA